MQVLCVCLFVSCVCVVCFLRNWRDTSIAAIAKGNVRITVVSVRVLCYVLFTCGISPTKPHRWYVNCVIATRRNIHWTSTKHRVDFFSLTWMSIQHYCHTNLFRIRRLCCGNMIYTMSNAHCKYMSYSEARLTCNKTSAHHRFFHFTIDHARALQFVHINIYCVLWL